MKQLVDEELFARYDRLLLQSSLDLMADVVYCPRQFCGTAVMVEPDTTMGICSACKYAFCTLCKLGYHGVSHCKIPAGNVMKNLVFLYFVFYGMFYWIDVLEGIYLSVWSFIELVAMEELRHNLEQPAAFYMMMP